ncbi:hypothetical protein DL96DRAFT_213457 [Flagelloscypha sp. PMI_526]|nr:hypothetical protein DL96DRAFT_213457 [Flagelloscypha sp. PMI_526]
MTVTQRKPSGQATEDFPQVIEPAIQYTCDACEADITHSIHIKCAEPICVDADEGSGIDMCPQCFLSGKEFKDHKAGHPYRVIEFNSRPILDPDWGADEELLLIKGLASHGMGNWRKVAKTIGTRTKEEVKEHYEKMYINSPDWPLPKNYEVTFNHDPEEFGDRKRRRLEAMNAAEPPAAKPAPVSAPGVHEISTYLPGRLEFEHEIENEAEDMVKDLEFGWVGEYGGNGDLFQEFAGIRVTNYKVASCPPVLPAKDIPGVPAPLISPDFVKEDPEDGDVKARVKWEEEKASGVLKRKRSPTPPPKPPPIPTKAPILPVRPPPQVRGKGVFNASTNGYVDARPHTSHSSPPPSSYSQSQDGANGKDEDEDEDEMPSHPPPIETLQSLQLKLAFLEMYALKIEKRKEGKAFIFKRGLTDYKKMVATDKKRNKEDKDILTRYKPFAKLTDSAEEWEEFSNGILYEHILRQKIQQLQNYRKLGLVTNADIERYDADLLKRTQQKTQSKEYYSARSSVGRGSTEPDDSVQSGKDKKSWKLPPINLTSSPSFHLLTPGEQLLCSSLRILPKPYLLVKETIIREYARRGGKLRRREARDLVKIDVNKTAKVWDFLVQSGCLKIGDMTSPGDLAQGDSQDAQMEEGSGTTPPAASSVPPQSAPPESVVSSSSAHNSTKPTIPSGLSRHTSLDFDFDSVSTATSAATPATSLTLTPNLGNLPPPPGISGINTVTGLPVMPNTATNGSAHTSTNTTPTTTTTTSSMGLPVMPNMSFG